jgi:hypothetical protein
MRKMTIAGLSATIAFVLGVSYGSAVRTTEVAQLAVPGANLVSIDVMQMMSDAKDLPVQQHDAI